MAESSNNVESSENDSWDLNLDLVEGEEIAQHTMVEDEEVSQDTIAKDKEVHAPKVGMVFRSENEAYNFYNEYARRMGFSIRKNSTQRVKSGRLRTREFVCSKEGFRRKDSRRNAPSKPRPQTRTRCKARILFKIQDNGDWIVTRFVEEHNHNFVSQLEVHFLRSQRKILPEQAGYMNSMRLKGCGPTQAFSIISAEHGGLQHLNCTLKDCDNYYQKRRKEIYKEGDAQIALNYFRRMQREDPSFSYAIQVDQSNQMCNLVWADAKSKIDYDFFGDVVCFDTTFRTNKYGMPCAPIVGVNHHGMPVLFGCALILLESTESFVWVFESFFNMMSGKQPKTILTDQGQAIANAIKKVLPSTHHRLCLWHIYQNAAKHLSHVYRRNKIFKEDFQKCIYNAETEEEFQLKWESMLDRYGLSSHEWLRSLYGVRQKWAPVYGREHFSAGMTTTQRSVSVNSFFKGYLKSTLCIIDFILHYEKAVLSWRQNEAQADFQSKQIDHVLTSRSNFEKQAAQVYTRNVFKTFLDGFKNFACYLDYVKEEIGSIYIHKVEMVNDVWRDRDRRVSFNSKDNTVECSCKSFEFIGILCVHALRVLLSRRIFQIPSRYILKRWTKDAKVGVVIDDAGITIQADRYSSDLAHRALTIVVKGVVDEGSSLVVKRHLAACLEELDAYQRKTTLKDMHVECQEHEIIEEVSEAHHTDYHMTLRDPPAKKKKGEQNEKFKSALEKNSRKAQKELKDYIESAPPSASLSLGGLVPPTMSLMPSQGLSRPYDQTVMINPGSVDFHFNQALPGHHGQAAVMQTSLVVPHFSQESMDSTNQSSSAHRLEF